jgi:hypothetical protein
MDHSIKEGNTGMTQSQLHSIRKYIEAGIVTLLRPVRQLLTKKAAGPRAKVLAAMSIFAVIGSMLIVQGTPQALAAQTVPAIPAKPVTDWSYYMHTTSTSRAYTLGCNQGHTDAANHRNSLAILDFGGQVSNGSGTEMIGAGFISNGQIEAASEAFAHGYWSCTGSDTTTLLSLGIGTNNSLADRTYSGGQTWSHIVSAVRSYNNSHGYSSQVAMYGANDIEPSWSPASYAISWAKGFNSVGGNFYFNYGSADGCPQTSSNNGSCNNGWNQYDVWYVSWGNPAALPTPQIYYSSQARQWAMLSLYSAQHHGARMNIDGPMDEYDLDHSTFTPTGAWDALWTDLHAHSSTAQGLLYSIEIHNE